MPSASDCPHCGAPRVNGPECPRCGIIYAKARAPRVEASSPPADGEWPLGPDAAFEAKLRTWSIPAAFAFFTLLRATGPGAFLMRAVFGRLVHECGHALAAWLLGYPALPLLWSTVVASDRSGLAVAILALVLGGLAVGYYRIGARRRAIAIGILLGVQLAGSLLSTPSTAEMIITFAGDLGCLVLGPALMALFLLGPDYVLNRGWLRWGWLTIGAAAFVDVFSAWWSARSDIDAIPFGAIEGVGLSDASKLCDVYDWTTSALVNRYVAAGIASLLVLVALYTTDHVIRRRAR